MRLARTLSLAAVVAVQFAIAAPASATFSGGNGHIGFETARTDEFDLWRMQPDGSNKKRLTTSGLEDHSPAWGYTGIVFSRNAVGGGPGDIFRMAFGGTGVHRLTNTPSVSEVDPAWSPDTEVPLSQMRVLFSSSRTGHGDLYTIRASDGANLTRITFSEKADLGPDWSGGSTLFPHGRIAFVSRRTGNGDLYVMKPNGSGLRRLTFSAGVDSQPSWNPDGKHIAFVSDRDADKEIFTINANGTGLRKLTNNDANDQGPVWAPEHDRIAFMSNRDRQTFEIYTMKPDGTGIMRLTHDGFVDGFPTWQPFAG